MYRAEIYQLECLIETYKDLCSELRDMETCWENGGDPSCDPGLQYEKECEIESAYDKIKDFVITKM